MRVGTLLTAVVVLMTVAVAFLPFQARAQTAQDTLIVGLQNDTPNLHPWDTATNSVWKAFVWRNWVYEGLFGLKPDGQYYPVLADPSRIGTTSGEAGWDTDATGLNITVYVRPGVTFTDGDPMDADDVVFTFQVMSFNSQLSDSLLASIVWDGTDWPRWNATTAWGAANPTHVGVEKIDATTVRFHLQQAYALFFEGVLTTPIMPMHIWMNHVVTVSLAPFGITGGTEFDFDRNFGSGSSPDPDATIGTGPWMLDYWVPANSAQVSVYAGYWGSGEAVNWNSRNWPFMPANLRTIQFKIYGSFDVVVLALKRGEVHIAPWGLSISQWNDLKQNPAMGFQVATNDGYFYLAFNMRRAPMSDLAFRRAISYAIDKDFIVNRLLGGFGIKGNLPFGPLNPAYINDTATVPTFDLNAARTELTAAGYIDRDLDGWREDPAGRPIKLNILTPAKDYDPVRADSGIMISNNLKAIGLNIDSAPTAFDAIVAAAFTAVEFDMYILGWVNLGLFPEFYLRDFFGCASDAKLGIGSNTPGYCDAQVDAWLTILDADPDSADRQEAARRIGGALARDIPYNTLYIRRQIEGYRADVWDGWVDVNGEIFNSYSLSILAPPGTVEPPAGALVVALELPATVRANTDLVGQVFAERSGQPASGASVNVSASYGAFRVVATDSRGYASFSIPVPFIAGAFTVVANATAQGETGGDVGTVTAIIPNPFAQLSLNSTTPVVSAGGTTTLTAKVTDRWGAAISGAAVSVIPELTLGTIAPASAATNAQGQAIFTYSAPASAEIPNKNLMDTIKMSVSVENTILPEVSQATYIMGVTNPIANWTVVRVESVADPVIDADLLTLLIPDNTDVVVQVTDQAGAPIANENVTAIVSDPGSLTVSPAWALTDGTGHATFTFATSSVDTAAVQVSFQVSRAFKSEDSLAILVSNSTSTGKALYVDVAPLYGPARGTFTITAHVFNASGAAGNMVEVNMFAPYTEAGQPPRFVGGTFTGSVGSDWSGMTDATGTVTVTANWATSGTGAIQGAFVGDSLITIETGAEGWGPAAAFIGYGAQAASWVGDTSVLARASPAVMEAARLSKPAFSFADSSGTLTWTFKNQAGAVSGLSVAVYRGAGDLRPGRGAEKLGDFTTSSTGALSITYVEPRAAASVGAKFTAVITDNRYALGGQFGSAPFENAFPYIVDPPTLVVSGATTTRLVAAGATDSFTLTVRDIFGNPVQGAQVSGGSATGVTDASGQVSLVVRAAAGINNVTFVAWDDAGRSGSVRLGTYGAVGVAALSNLAVNDTTPVRGSAVTISASVQNTGLVTATFVLDLRIDGTTVAQKSVTVDAGQTASVSFTWAFTDTATHQVTIGTLAAVSVTAEAPPTDGGTVVQGLDTTLAIGMAVGLLIVGVIVGMLLGKRGGGGKPSSMASMRAEKLAEEPPAEEELPPEL